MAEKSLESVEDLESIDMRPVLRAMTLEVKLLHGLREEVMPAEGRSPSSNQSMNNSSYQKAVDLSYFVNQGNTYLGRIRA